MVNANTLLLAFSSLAGLVACHFTLDTPLSRGFSEDDEPTAPCGGFDTVSLNRTLFPSTGGQYQIDVHHALSTVSVVLSKDGATFGSTAVQQYTVTGLGTVCAQLNDLSGFSAGENVTMQIIFKASTESNNLYQCADLQLTNATLTSPSVCSNGPGIVVSNLKTGSIDLSSTSSDASSTSTSSSNATTSSSPSSSASSSSQTNGAQSSAGMISMREMAVIGFVASVGFLGI